MKLEDFKIKQRFWLAGKEWQCMDIAQHHVLGVAIDEYIRKDPTWLNGPPYAVGLTALDAYDWPACYPTREEWEKAQQEQYDDT